MKPANKEHYFLADGGEMGELFRSKDWNKTSLGDPETWPQSLCTMVALILNNPFGMCIAWGNNYTQLYNDAFRPILGSTKHPQALGISSQETFLEIWDTISPMFNDVMKGKAVIFPDFIVVLNRNGFDEECYFDFSFSPIKKENREIGGVLVTAIETTEKKKATQAKTISNVTEIPIEVTSQVLARSKVEEREQKIRQLVENAPFPIAVYVGKEMIVELANDSIIKIWGKGNDVIGKSFKDVLPELDNQLVFEQINTVLETGKSFHTKNTPLDLTVDGKLHTYYFNYSLTPLYDINGSIYGVMNTGVDLTDLNLAKKRTQESEKRFRSLTESIPQLIWETDEKGNSLFASGKWFEYTGIKPGGEAEWKAMIHPEDYEENLRIWSHSLATGEVYRCDVRMRRKDGNYRWHTAIGEPVFDKDNKIIKWVGAFTDIHTEKAFTHELEKQVIVRTKELSQINESLRKSEERYHLMVEEVQDYAILYLNHEGIIENWNIGAEKIKGYKANEIIGKYFSIFYTEEDRKSNLPQKLLNLAIENGKATQEGWRVRKNGTLFWANVVITAIHNKKNQVIGFTKMTHDLTEKKRASDKLKQNALELEQKNTELEQMNKELQSFAYISSHDLQEPLRKIQTFATQIMENESRNLSDNGKDKFQRMQNAAQRMQTLINDLLSYSRTNIQERIFEQTDLAKIIDEVKDDLKEELEQKNAIIESVKTCKAHVIPFQLRQLLYNLVSNSLKFSKPEIQTIIKINCEIIKGSAVENDSLNDETNYCHIRITDNGIGFEQQYSSKIFEVFQRLHGKLEYTGTGIGLAIVKKIVDNHNGIITATGEQNIGATFDIYIPLLS